MFTKLMASFPHGSTDPGTWAASSTTRQTSISRPIETLRYTNPLPYAIQLDIRVKRHSGTGTPRIDLFASGPDQLGYRTDGSVVEPASSPTLTTGHKVGSHRIQGISDEFIPPIVHLGELDGILQANDGDAILMAQALAHSGLAVGISSGANVIGALRAQEQLGPDAIVVTVLCDSNKKYLSTDLLRAEPARPGYLTPEVELVSYDSVNRVCDICIDPVR